MNKESRKELMTAEEVAQLLNIKKGTLLRWARDGKIERVRISAKVILFRGEAIEEFVKSRIDVVKLEITNERRAGRNISSPSPMKKGGDKRSSGELSGNLRKEVLSWL